MTENVRVRWEPEPKEITLGDIAKALEKLAKRGASRECVLFCVDKVNWPPARD